MRTLDVNGPPLTVLALGAHADDVEIGCGGTLGRLAGDGRLARVRWVVFSADDARAAEARAGAEATLAATREGGTVPLEVEVHGFRDGYFPSLSAPIKDEFERLKADVEPDLVFAPLLEDRHQDHRLIAELAWNTFRDHLILEYEIPKYEGDLGPRNVFVPLPEGAAERKVEMLETTFHSQRDRHWFDARTFLALMRLRGLESRAPSGYAEAFHARKLIL
jgi:LmbE family N-acetylglucosaminyl deacetylase